MQIPNNWKRKLVKRVHHIFKDSFHSKCKKLQRCEKINGKMAYRTLQKEMQKQNMKYCMKENDFRNRESPRQGKRNDIHIAKQMVLEGGL